MIEDTSSRPLKEWYEASPEPDVPEFFGPRFTSPWMRRGRSQALTWKFTPTPEVKVGDIWKDKDGNPIGVVQSVDLATGQMSVILSTNVQPMVDELRKAAQSIGTHLHQRMEGLSIMMSHLDEAVKKAHPELAPFIVPADETVREKALRLKQQPHSMAQSPDSFHFDHRGRRRY